MKIMIQTNTQFFFLCWVDAQLRVGVIIFGSVQFLSKKNKQTEFFFKKNQNQTKTSSNRLVFVRFFRTKTSSNRFVSFFRFGSAFSDLAQFF